MRRTLQFLLVAAFLIASVVASMSFAGIELAGALRWARLDHLVAPAPSAPAPAGEAAPQSSSTLPRETARGADAAATGTRITQPAPGPGLKIEVARLAAGGVSVLAGRAPPGSRVVVLANGRAVAEATASEDGQWSAVVDGAIGAGPVDLMISARVPGGAEARSPVEHVVVAAASPAPDTAAPRRADIGPRPPDRQAARGGAADLQRFADVVARARSEPPPRPGDAPAAPLPVPITFESNADVMTGEGQRAAMLLAEYLRLKQPASITLSGHADSRGPDDYNVDLSRRRLEAIERFIRASGYQGRLALQPKGKSEPYAGIDREHASRDAIWQADRRVELRMSH